MTGTMEAYDLAQSKLTDYRREAANDRLAALAAGEKKQAGRVGIVMRRLIERVTPTPASTKTPLGTGSA